jgi:hypothetical protein
VEPGTPSRALIVTPTGRASRGERCAAGQPLPAALGALGGDEAGRAHSRGELWWYTPYHAVQRGDLFPTLPLEQANDCRQVLELIFTPYPHNEEFQTIPWGRPGRLHGELGRFSEDALWARRPVDCTTGEILGEPIGPADGVMDFEDKDDDGHLDFSDDCDEDTGRDGIKQGPSNAGCDFFFHDSEEYSDPAGTDPEVCEAFSQINGTEYNGRLDSEDLDGDGVLDLREFCFSYCIDLADTTYIATDVSRDFASASVIWPHALATGWRLICIALRDEPILAEVNFPAWNEIRQIRLWITGLPRQHRIQIGAIRIVGLD